MVKPKSTITFNKEKMTVLAVHLYISFKGYYSCNNNVYKKLSGLLQLYSHASFRLLLLCVCFHFIHRERCLFSLLIFENLKQSTSQEQCTAGDFFTVHRLVVVLQQ